MRATKLLSAVFGVSLIASSALAQGPSVTYGMFGQRVLGQPLNPRLSTSKYDRNGLLRGPAGEFRGINAFNPANAFPGMPWQTQRIDQPMSPFLTNRDVVQAYQQTQFVLENQVAQQHQTQLLESLANAALNPPPNQQIPPYPQPAPVSQFQAPTGESPTGASGPQGQDQWLRAPIEGVSNPAGVAPVPTATTVSRPLPPPLAIGFAPARGDYSPAVAVAKLIQSTGQIQKVTPITATMAGEAVVLRGEVATERDRELVAMLARLQPGIWSVRNEVVVSGQPRPAVSTAPSSPSR